MRIKKKEKKLELKKVTIERLQNESLADVKAGLIYIDMTPVSDAVCTNHYYCCTCTIKEHGGYTC